MTIFKWNMVTVNGQSLTCILGTSPMLLLFVMSYAEVSLTQSQLTFFTSEGVQVSLSCGYIIASWIAIIAVMSLCCNISCNNYQALPIFFIFIGGGGGESLGMRLSVQNLALTCLNICFLSFKGLCHYRVSGTAIHNVLFNHIFWILCYIHLCCKCMYRMKSRKNMRKY